MTGQATSAGGRRAVAGLAAVATAVLGVAVAAPAAHATDAAASPATQAANTLVVHADQPFRAVTHVATGSLYGLADATNPSLALASAIKPSEFVLKPSGGTQQGTGDILVTAANSEALGAKVVDRLSDYYPGWPYQFSWDTWDDVVTNELAKVNPTTVPNLAAYAPWNEADNTWQSSNGTFEDFWTHTYNLIRSIDKTTPIQGPSFSDNISDMDNFLKNAVATNTVPDILAWHELEKSSKIAGDIATVEALEAKYGITPRPIDIEEYAAPSEVGIPGDLIGYIAKFERLGVSNAELAFWNQSGTLGDLLTQRGGDPNGAYWLYTWYADMSGQMVTTTPPTDGAALFDAAASVTSDKKEVDVIAGGNSGPTTIQVAGLDKTAVGSRVDVKLEYTASYGRTTATAAPVTISDTTYRVGADGTISVPVVMNPAYGYHVVVTPAKGTHTSLAGVYSLTNLNSGLVLDTAGSGTTTGTLATQAVATGSTTQTWRLVDAGRGLYKVVNDSGLVLGIQDASTSNGAPALVWSDSGTDDPLWQVVPDGAGHYRFASYDTGLVLAVDSMSKDAGAQVVQWTDGSVTSGCTADGPRQPGEIGSALSFCNTPSYVTLPTGALSSLTGDFTVSVWVNPASNASWSRVFDIGTGSSASMFLTLNDGTVPRFAITTGSGAGGEQRIDGTSLLPLNQWSLLTITLSGTTGTMYVDGKVVGTNTAMTNHPSAFGQSTKNYIGKSQYSSDAALNASVDDFNVYSRALSASEVATLASGQAGAGDVVHYAFDETGGTTVVDSSGAGRDGTVVAANSSTSTTATDAATADHFWTLTAVGPRISAVSVADGDTVSGEATFGVDLAGDARDVSYTYIELNKGSSHVWVTDNTKAPGSTNHGLHPRLVVDTARLANGTYGLKIDAVGTNGKTTEKTVSFTIHNEVPGAPTGVGVGTGERVAKVSWTAPVSDGGSPVTGYTVTAAPGGASCMAAADATSCRVTGLADGRAYRFSVVATNEVGDSVAATSAPVTLGFPAGGESTSVGVSAKAQCVSGKASLAVYVLDKEQVKVDVRVTTPLGEQKVSGLAASQATYLTFAGSSSSLDAGTGTVAAYKYVDGAGHYTTYQIAWDAVSCG